MTQVSTSPLVDKLDIRSVNQDEAAATTDINCTSIEMQGAQGVIFIAATAVLSSGAVTSLKAEDSDDDSVWTDITSASVTIADDDDQKLAILDAKNNGKKKWMRCTVERGTANAVIDRVIAIRYGIPGDVGTHTTRIAPVSV